MQRLRSAFKRTRNASRQSYVSEGMANIQCEKIEFITAQMVEDISIANFDRISRDQALRAVIVVVMDGDTSGAPPRQLCPDSKVTQG